ncbi:hypothetical protein HPP92_004782 [Vanilla planifolia]|uniref:50S ribosomal protein L12, chloroplastic n=1 Tax=Vanilla planifolia TaxID=51239 RepID=A0A835V8T0_VANPL|nr:hypothetical protein HPP92_005137 [Vanilla planifolia]KAG0493788.1 hypothetical protein HPP92_004782 [Vanilla planifolia]
MASSTLPTLSSTLFPLSPPQSLPAFAPQTLKLPSFHRCSRGRAARLVPIFAAAAASPKIEQLSTQIENLTLAEAKNLVDLLQDRLGVSAASFAPAGVAVAPGSGEVADASEDVVEEKTQFDVIIEDVPTSARIATIKVVRSLTTLALKEAKDLIEGLPKKFKEALPKEEAESVKKKLEEVGAKVSLV